MPKPTEPTNFPPSRLPTNRVHHTIGDLPCTYEVFYISTGMLYADRQREVFLGVLMFVESSPSTSAPIPVWRSSEGQYFLDISVVPGAVWKLWENFPCAVVPATLGNADDVAAERAAFLAATSE